MNRKNALEAAQRYYGNGSFIGDLSRRIAFATESQEFSQRPVLRRYLEDEIGVALAEIGFSYRLWENPIAEGPPFLFAERSEPGNSLTVLMYAHGDVVRGDRVNWTEGLDPWKALVKGDRIYGRGSADNKGQHTINIGSLAAVIGTRAGKLGFNIKLLMEMGEEVGSPGLADIVELKKQALRADLFIASDGPRLSSDKPTLSLGSRGYANFSLSVHSRAKSYHSGNWGGLLSNPAVILTNALASIVDSNGAIKVEKLLPPAIPQEVRDTLASIEIRATVDGPAIATGWGQPGLSTAEKLYAWNTFEILAIGCADAEAPVNAIPRSAIAHCHMRFVVGTAYQSIETILREHLDNHGFDGVEIHMADSSAATRLNPNDPWVDFAVASISRSVGRAPVVLPNIGGSIPNDMFAHSLGLPTLWIPHSYAACAQHAPDEHLLTDIVQEGLRIMAGLWWDLGTFEFTSRTRGVTT
ncbi:M20 family metallopeptidase [Pseudomonas fluorescens]|uniref:M20 family metallopeptidase n=1 Tax=Pseudomonas fluorescens TaxID=294 RepID=UPI000732289F|nr:M20 family metallopeptidase [Pseudomonas fluorescens]